MLVNVTFWISIVRVELIIGCKYWIVESERHGMEVKIALAYGYRSRFTSCTRKFLSPIELLM